MAKKKKQIYMASEANLRLPIILALNKNLRPDNFLSFFKHG